jgi:predicted lipoprotein with Yx(FWY)xxD motif
MTSLLHTLVAIAAAASSAFAAAGSGHDPAAPAESTALPRAALRAGASPYGRMLFDGKGRALYLFTRDRTHSRCFGACARAWPPFVVRTRPRAGRGVSGRLIGTIRRPGGKRQVTYRGHPLYYYVGDRRPGQVLCQDVVEFGGRWLVVAPSGRPIR